MGESGESNGPATVRAAGQLLLVGGVLSILLSPAFLLLQPGPDAPLAPLTQVILDMVLGAILLLGTAKLRESVLTGVLLGLVAAIGLLSLGSLAGRIGGLFGLVGALVGIVALMEHVVRLLENLVEDARSLLRGERKPRSGHRRQEGGESP